MSFHKMEPEKIEVVLNSPSSETGGYFNKLPPGILPHGMPEVKSIKPAVTKEEEKMNKQVWPPTHFFSCFHYHIFPNGQVTSNKMVHKETRHFLAQFSIPFHMVCFVVSACFKKHLADPNKWF